jgi:exopolyphosphatase/guanosine-5'-triphosphate,3'-diphosphate pyrophosphatase
LSDGRKVFAVIDLGFNSLKMVTYRVNGDNSFKAIDEISVKAKLGDGLSYTGFLSNESMERTISAIRLLGEIIKIRAINHVSPVATSAVREAGNREEFLRRVYREAHLRFRVLSDKEEALYSYLGAARGTGISNMLFFDIGGGSLEIVYAKRFEVRKIFPLPLGALRLTQLYANGKGKLTKKKYLQMRKHVTELLPDSMELRINEDTALVGVGGTVRALARYDQELKNYPLNKTHNYVISAESVSDINERLQEMQHDEITKIESIGGGRAATIAAGVCVIDTLMKKLDFEKLVVSTNGLRDGILCAQLEFPNSEIDQQKIHNYLKANISLNQHSVNAQQLLLQNLIDEREASIISHALKAMENSSDHSPEDTFYIVMNEDSMLSHRDQLTLTLSLASVRKPRVAHWFFERYKQLFKPQNKKSIRRIAAIIRLISILEKTGSEIRLRRKGERSIWLDILTRDGKIPLQLLENVIKEFEDTLDVSVDYWVSKATKQLAEAAMEGVVQ